METNNHNRPQTTSKGGKATPSARAMHVTVTNPKICSVLKRHRERVRSRITARSPQTPQILFPVLGRPLHSNLFRSAYRRPDASLGACVPVGSKGSINGNVRHSLPANLRCITWPPLFAQHDDRRSSPARDETAGPRTLVANHLAVPSRQLGMLRSDGLGYRTSFLSRSMQTIQRGVLHAQLQRHPAPSMVPAHLVQQRLRATCKTRECPPSCDTVVGATACLR